MTDDSAKPVKQADFDRPKPINDARLAALEELSALDQELELKYGIVGNPMIKAQQHTGASGGSLANYPAIPDRCLRGSTVEQRSCEPPVAGSTPAAGLYVQWIPAKERLPERGENVLWLVDVYGGFHHAIGCIRLNETIFSDEGIQYWVTEKTFWMPLPAPPTNGK